jgi:hypothetical protein
MQRLANRLANFRRRVDRRALVERRLDGLNDQLGWFPG